MLHTMQAICWIVPWSGSRWVSNLQPAVFPGFQESKTPGNPPEGVVRENSCVWRVANRPQRNPIIQKALVPPLSSGLRQRSILLFLLRGFHAFALQPTVAPACLAWLAPAAAPPFADCAAAPPASGPGRANSSAAC